MVQSLIVKDYLSKLKIKTDYLFTITSYGSAETGAIRALKICNKIIEKNNQKVNYSNHVLMVDNFIPVFDMQKEIEIKDDALIDEKILKIKKKDIQNRTDLEVPKSIIAFNIH